MQTRARVELAKIDVLLVPTAAHHYTIAEIAAQEQAEGEVTTQPTDPCIPCTASGPVSGLASGVLKSRAAGRESQLQRW